MGSYYEFAPHQVYSGFGAHPLASYYEFAPHQVYSGFGAFEFSGAQVWSDWVAGTKCCAGAMAGKAGCHLDPSCKKARAAVDTIRAGLQQLGYGGLGMGAIWGSKDQAALKKFTTDMNIQASGGMPTKGNLLVMEEKLTAGEAPGPHPPIETHKVGEEFVPGPAPGETPLAKAGMGMGGFLALGLVGLAVVGGVVLVRSRKKGRR
jgi:hypothetical protein